MSDLDTDLNKAKAEAVDARARLTDTLVEIQHRLNPRALARDVIEEVRDTGIEIAHAAIAAARRNSLPLLGVGAGLAFMVAQRLFGAQGKPAAPGQIPASPGIPEPAIPANTAQLPEEI
ncbi:MAG: DUF3618 domain-containing protein [Sphingomonas sp.]|jgi:hypothetical protein